MKCPHCGMNIRDNIEICGYCGGKIEQESETSPSGTGRPEGSGGSAGQNGAGTKASGSLQQESESDEEEEGGISVYLQPGEQVLIGSLNIAVKKFSFHAYLTNQRIFLIDTQEKKVKVTAKDIPRESIVGSSLEYSESSDPLLVLSLKSADDEIKTMKLIFIQNGLDRSDEIDEWIALLKEHTPLKKIPAPREKELPEEKEERPAVPKEKPVQKQELQPKRKPGKDLEKQPPVKRHVVFHTMPEEVPEVEEPRAQRRSTVREVPEPVKKLETEHEPSYYEISPARRGDTQPLRKREVQSAMKVAMKNAMQPLKPSSLQSVKRPVTERASSPVKEPVPEDAEGIGRQAGMQEPAVPDERNELPPFCQNCGKKIPPAANFCPGCGTKLGAYKAGSPEWIPPSEKKTAHHEPPSREKRAPPDEEIDEEEKEDQAPVPTKPPAKKGPKGSEMTILHKFLRR
jgi:hypothetical protein